MPEQPQVVFADGAGYERMMGDWSARVGTVFLDWIAPPPGLDWLDVGCGTGAFSHLVLDRTAPDSVTGIDPSSAQLDYARERLAGRRAKVLQGDALALPFPDGSFDAAAMALVIFFAPDPPRAVREMARVVRPGGLVVSYSWDILGGGLPMEPFRTALAAMDVIVPMAPHPEAAVLATLRDMWRDAGLTGIETREITVRRDFPDFATFWSVYSAGPLSQVLAALSPDQTNRLRTRLRETLDFGPDGDIRCTARATAIKGHVPA